MNPVEVFAEQEMSETVEPCEICGKDIQPGNRIRLRNDSTSTTDVDVDWVVHVTCAPPDIVEHLLEHHHEEGVGEPDVGVLVACRTCAEQGNEGINEWRVRVFRPDTIQLTCLKCDHVAEI